MAKQLWLASTFASMHRSSNDVRLNGVASFWAARALSETQGTGALSVALLTVAGPTNGIEFTDGTFPLEWITEPLSADFTISGTITGNLWAAEGTMNDNAAVNFNVERINGATGALTQICKSAFTTELPVTTRAVQNFTATPTSTACNRGDRLRVRVFLDDAGVMAASGSNCSLRVADVTPGADGDSWIQFTENLTFEASGDPSGSTYYLTDTAESINPGSATEKKALTTRGSGSVNAVTNTATGPTAGIQITDSGGGTAIEWYTPPLNAFTLGGKAKLNVRALESSTAANASLRAEVAVTATDGSGATVWGIANLEATLHGFEGEITASDAAYAAWPSGDDTAVTAGQRLRVRIYVDDPGTGALAAGSTVTVSYSGTSAVAAGDTYVILPQAVTEQTTAAVIPDVGMALTVT